MTARTSATVELRAMGSETLRKRRAGVGRMLFSRRGYEIVLDDVSLCAMDGRGLTTVRLDRGIAERSFTHDPRVPTRAADCYNRLHTAVERSAQYVQDARVGCCGWWAQSSVADARGRTPRPRWPVLRLILLTLSSVPLGTMERR